MKTILLFLVFIFISLSVTSQTTSRTEVKGIILSETNDVEAVTIFNKSSNKGTITNKNGEFSIKVALNDVIEISALQFQTVSITIDDEVIKSKQLKIQLVEQVNQLDAITLSSGLSGNIEADIQNVKIVKLKTLDMGNMDVDFEYNDDKAFDKGVIQNDLTATINPEARNYLPDVVKIFKLFKKSKANLSLKKDLLVDKDESRSKDILDVYSHKFINEAFNIPLENVESFIAFVEEKEVKQELFKTENEIKLIEFLYTQSQQFLKQKDGKN